MAGNMFQDVVSPRADANRRWYTLPLSFLAHTSILSLLIIVPLIATDILPKPRMLMHFTEPFVPVVPSAPPVRHAVSARAVAGTAGGAALAAPQTIGVESGMIFEPGDVSTGSIDSIPGAIDIGQITVEQPPMPVPAPPARYIPGGNIKPPMRTRYVPPQYPDIAKSARVEGTVVIEAVIGTNGRVEDARVLRSKPLLDEAALAAVRAWEYSPTLLNGKATSVIMTVTVQFSLK